ncbi:MAG: transposase [Muribaculaceae bacterium]|nr:transposase [Muribaculaceae bacterium]
MKKIAIGIDFSKKTFDVTIVRRDEDSFKELAYNAFPNDAKGFKSFEKWVKTTLKPTPESRDKSAWLFCGENTGTYSIPLCDYLTKAGYFMWLESALVIHRKCGIVREKNDRIDSIRIAEYALRNYSDKIRPYELDSKDLKSLKSLYAAHSILTKDKTAKINQIKSGVFEHSSLALDMIKTQLEYIRKRLHKIDEEIRRLLSMSVEFSHNYDILNTFKGVGVLTIAFLIIKTRNFKDMTDPRELGCYMGVVPHRCQSGTSVDKQPRTSRYRDSTGNALLSTCVIIALTHNNPVIKPYFDRLVARGVNCQKALNNCKFKIINVLLAMIRNDRPFDMDIHGKSKKLWQKTA